MKKTFAFLFFAFLGMTMLFAQNPQLPDNIQTVHCEFFPEASQWGIVEDWSSTADVSTLVIPMVGDIDSNGIPEIVCFAPSGSDFYNVNTVLVFNSLTHEVIHTFTIPGNVSTVDAAPYGIVKLHNGHVLFAVCAQNNNMYGYDLTVHGTTPLWTVATGFPAPNVGFADFNADGYPDIYVGNKVFDAETGTLLVTDSSVTNFGGSYAHTGSHKLPSPCVANLTGDIKPELVLGNEVYQITITNRTGTAGNSMTLSASVTPPSGIDVDGHPQVADFNLDGYLDVFISNKTTSGGTMGLYVWDVHNNAILGSTTVSQTGTGKSIPLVADIDGDNNMEIVIQSRVSGNKVQAYKFNRNTGTFSMMWDIAVDEDSYSNAATTFDFNQDGDMEVLLTDQSSIKILNGATGALLTQLSFGECTVMQYPIIADVDADGNAEIAICGQFGAGHTNSGHLVVFSSSTVPWAPARKVWNQYMYNVTNINQDLSVPTYLFNNATVFTDPQGHVRRPFNNFLQQATTLDQYGRPFYGVPDAADVSATVETTDTYALLSVTYTNQGDAVLNRPYAITLFANTLGGQIILTHVVNESLRQGQTTTQTIQVPLSTLCQIDNLATIVVAVNCEGGGIGQDGGLQAECDIANNTAEVPFSMVIEPTNIYEEACDSYTWYGQTYTQSGEYTHVLNNPNGCDSTYILHLTINQSATTQLEMSTCEPYYWYGQTYSQSGTYEHHLQTIAGCDSLLVLHLTIGEAYNSEITVEACDLYHWRGQDYTQSGTYTQTVQVPEGCDSTFVLHLTINYSDVGLLEATACGEYTWFGETYTESGVYEHLLQNSAGCDSLLILTLTIGEAYSFEEEMTTCNSYTWHGQTYIESGTYTDVIPGPDGCDSTFVLHLTLGHDVQTDTIANVCQYFTWYGQTYYESGDYEHLMHTSIGCDSLVILHLEIGDVSVISEEVTACNSFEWHGHTYFESGQYSETIENPDGCDTIYRLNLHIGFDAVGDTTAMTCEPFTWYGQTYTQSGDYDHLLFTPYGCDSLVTLHFTIGDAMLHPAEVVETCEPNFTWHGHAYTESGIYYDTVAGIAGCDDIYMLQLTIGEAVEMETEDKACDVYPCSWAPGGAFTESGVYSHILQTEEGCDSIVKLNLTIYHTPELDLSGPTQVIAATNLNSGVYYYWLADSLSIEPNSIEWVCSTLDWRVEPIGNGYRCRLTVMTTGEGTLKAISHQSTGCDAAAGINIHASFYDIEENGAPLVTLFPNPAQTKVTVQCKEMLRIRLVDVLGQAVMDKDYGPTDEAILAIGHLPAGVYLVEITTKQGRTTRRLVVER